MHKKDIPPYTIRHSARAKRISLRVLPGRGVEVVLPPGVDQARAHNFVQAKADWLHKTMRRLSMEQQNAPLLPRRICLRAVSRSWEVRYGHTRATGLELRENTDALQFVGSLADAQDAKNRDAGHCELLKQWLKFKGREHLPFWTRTLEGETGLRCRTVQIRLQRTRWGSCSNRKTLSLNASLLFLPPDLTRHVLLHELCHTIHLNHSPEFWKLLSSLDPQAREHDAALTAAWQHVPAWVMS